MPDKSKLEQMDKYELEEVNCERSFVTVTIRGDIVASVANALMACHDGHRHANAIRCLGSDLKRSGDMIYGAVDPAMNLDVAHVVVTDQGEFEEQKKVS